MRKKLSRIRRRALFTIASRQSASAVLPAQNPMAVESQRALVEQYCSRCHNDRVKSGGFSWAELDLSHPEANTTRAEKSDPKDPCRHDASSRCPAPGPRNLEGVCCRP